MADDSTQRPAMPPRKLSAHQMRIGAARMLGMIPRQPQPQTPPPAPRTAAEALYPHLANQNRKD